MKLNNRYFKGALGALLVMVTAGGIAFAAARETVVEKKGVVSQILMNPEGDADGFLLEDGSQVHFPPHLSQDLRGVVAVKEPVTIKGVQENGKVFRADVVTNTKTNKSVKETPPALGRGTPPPPPVHPGAPRGPGAPRAGLAAMNAEGKITSQLFGPRGEVNGVVLSSGAIVHVGPRALDKQKVDLSVGKSLSAAGFGTKNEFGESLEATDLKNL